MPLHRWLRSAVAVYVMPFFAVYLVILLGDGLDFVEDNWRDGTVKATSAAVLAFSPPLAAIAAWESWRLRRAGVHPGVGVRGPARIMMWSLLPMLGCAAVGMLAAFGALFTKLGDVPGTPDVLVIGTATLVLSSWAVVGFAAGRWSHPAIGVPVLLVAAWFWLAYPVALDPLWLRHLTGYNDGACCRTDAVFDGRVLAAQAVLAGSLLVAAFLVWSSSRRPVLLRASAVLLPLTATVIAIGLVKGLGPYAERPRSSGLVCRTYSRLQVCVWNERRKDLDRDARLIYPAVTRISAAGLPRPERVTEGPADQKTSWSFVAAPDSSEADLVVALAGGFLPSAELDCPKRSAADGGGAYNLVGAWLAVKGGVEPAQLVAKVGDENVAMIQHILARSESAQLSWFRQNLAALTDCDIEPREVSTQ
ncbi:hypothetical protein AGRA3207_005876 [Actinomadura graeca]|uniref:DUF7224 domain-containing protein n=1 Tax=Actinomadura graeca TaxID=2750812 RepID=A0ABX8R1V7_9ACTN|nr:hypothetical protein [Actinomadura graeca]QXJ24536.1 hypothetical protein AGRA3207_005876 [Actinomadura graeca]